jgi:hypothetical protein
LAFSFLQVELGYGRCPHAAAGGLPHRRHPGEHPAELDDPQVREREARGLVAARTEHPRTSLHLVTWTPESASGLPEGVRVHPAWQWLLGPFLREE